MQPLSENLARFRKARDLSQERLAERAGVGVDTIARIEQGTRTTTRPHTLHRLAAALGVSHEQLLGTMPTTYATIDVAPLRRAITSGQNIPGLTEFAENDETMTVDELVRNAHQAWRAYVDGRHGELLHSLPAVLADTRRVVHDTLNDERGAAYRVLSTAYRLCAGIAGRLDLDDLAWTAAERALAAARHCDNPDIEAAISLRYLAWTLVRQGRTADAEHVAVQAAEKIQPDMFDRDPIQGGVFGNLLFNAASAALAGNNPQRADDLLAEASAAAARTRGDSASEAAIFGPRVAALQVIDSIARADDPEKALTRARTIPAPRGEVPAFWEAGHRLRLAAAALACRHHAEALTHLADARDLAPDWVRCQPLGKNVMAQLVDRATRRRGTTFANLAQHYGVVPN
ncbi:helix-turn-helix transcriptional regulator [Haloechinothrix salitolerans]|uniref:Helix-turn-helix domain-containing protein n=1 Tax=Haloechinothrix salitolerans TaxID=926830 RepID=A0ABW2C537_9PSEU